MSPLLLFSTIAVSVCERLDRQILSYAAIPNGVYVPSKNSSIVTLLDVVKSHDDLSILAEVLEECGGTFQQ
jgi:hypothetical protein